MIRVAATADIGPGAALVVSADGKTLALFHVDGAYYAVDNSCPHRGGPLGEGDLDRHVVSCPWHGWAWDVRSGANVNNPAVRIGCYPVIVQEGALFVQLTS